MFSILLIACSLPFVAAILAAYWLDRAAEQVRRPMAVRVQRRTLEQGLDELEREIDRVGMFLKEQAF